MKPNSRSAHTFHIPVMGTGFTIDTSLRVARYGISSVISLVDDTLIEQMRRFHCEKAGEPYQEITKKDEDCRARRITAYLNLLDRIVARQVEELQGSRFEAGSEITRYYEMLPDTPLKRAYHNMLATEDPAERAQKEEELRRAAVPGSVDVNIMTKLNREVYQNGRKLPPEYADALAALRGYAKSELNSSIVFSAGINPRLYSYVAEFDDFFPGEDGELKKRIVLKVSDYRSALIQGKFLAKKGLWVSEFRIESGLNCGGHAFATAGYLMGPILEEFKQKRSEIVEGLHELRNKGLVAAGRERLEEPQDVLITVQGGIGTSGENELLLKYYQVDGTGWGTPFLLVPEATNVDELHLKKLVEAKEGDVVLTQSSPIGIPFWSLINSASEEARRRRIERGKPGSPCPKGHLRYNTEFTKLPICIASGTYQILKLRQINEEAVPKEELSRLRESVLRKTCICNDLGGNATVKHGIDRSATPSICCGPNIVNLSKIASLEEMVGHIYGRLSLPSNPARAHMFIGELKIYVDYIKKELERFRLKLSTYKPKDFWEFKENILAGIEYYQNLAKEYIEQQKETFLNDLKESREEIERLLPDRDTDPLSPRRA